MPAKLLNPPILLLLIYLTSACTPVLATPRTSQVIQTHTPMLTTQSIWPTPTITTSPSPTPTIIPPTIWLPDYLPEMIVSSFLMQSMIQPSTDEKSASIKLDLLTDSNILDPDSIPWIYALVAPFPTMTDDVSLNEIQEVWTIGKSSDLLLNRLLVDPSTNVLFTKKWGRASNTVTIIPIEQMLEAAWSDNRTWAILPFEQLEPRWKVISVNGQSPLSKEFSPSGYGLTLSFGLTGPQEWVSMMRPLLSNSNRQSDKLTTVVLTGVTALVRGTASLMEGQGMTYPARDIGDWLRDADILHINNEVPFAKNCPQPFDWVDLVFCSQTEYIQLLDDIGTDVVELTGDHFKDWGQDAMLYTLDLYKERGWKYYGGGANSIEASKPALFEHNGNRLAFIGCNAKEPGYAGASATSPGALHCDFENMEMKVKSLTNEGYLPIVTFQHLEYYQYVAHPILQADFRRMASAGAVIVSGSQAHQPHAFEFQPNSFLHYGLGNLFFDQTNQGDPPRTAFIDRHVFYNGRHIGTELLTIYLVDYARSRPMTQDERQDLLRNVFIASGWKSNLPDN